jgi:putative inorganic carbon (HCO3(-)) transporter
MIEKHVMVRTRLDVPIAFLVAITLIGLYTSADLSASLPSLWRICLGVAIYYGLVNGVRNEAHLHWMTLALITGCLGVTLLTLLGTRWSIVRLASWPGVYDRLPSLFRAADGDGAFHPRMMGMALATLFPLPVAILLFGQTRVGRILSALLVPFMAIVMLLTQSVQALMGVGTALLLLAIWRSPWSLLTIPLGAGLFWWGITAYSVQRIAGKLLSVDDLLGIGVVLRLDIWSRALEMIGDMPYTGIGLNTFPVIQSNFYPGFLIGPELHAHNLLLQVALDLGLFGLAAFLWLLIASGFTVAQAYRLRPDRDGRALSMGLAAALVSYVASQAIETYWETAPGVIFWVLLGSAAVILRLGAGPAGSEIQYQVHGRSARTLAWLLPPVLLALCSLITPHVWQRNLAILQAHKQLIWARSASLPPDQSLESTIQKLRQAQIRAPDNVQIYSLLGSLYAWRGDYAAAIEAFQQRAALDIRNPIGHYALFEALRRTTQHENEHNRLDDTIRVYSQWMQRFPTRAEEYVQVAVIWHRYKGNRKRAATVLQSGLDHGAEPRGLLLYYTGTLETLTAGSDAGE